LAISRYKIASIKNSVPDVKIFRLDPIEGKVPQFFPGQFAFIHLLGESGNSVLKRPYSIASSPSSPYLEFGIEMRGGQMTSRLDALREGQTVGIEGPLGHMAYKGEKKAAFIAGGVGVTPFISTLRHIAEKKISGTFVLFYSVRSADRIVYKDELEALQKKNPGIKAVITLTREAPPGWMGECGRINDALISKHLPQAKEFDWFLCGPPEMVKGVRACLEGLGADPKKIKMEGWG